MDLGIEDKCALVMGASSGIGKAVAQALRREGAKVVICARGKQRLEESAREIGAHPMVCDFSTQGAGKAAVEEAVAHMGRVDILLVNTGGPPTGTFVEIGNADWQAGFQSLWLSCAEAMRAAYAGMKERGWGRILLVTSVAAKEPVPNLTVSNALRAGLLGMVNTFSREAASSGVTVNALLPGYTKTERLAELGIPDEQLAAQVPARRLGRPEEFAALTTFLASEKAGYITGQAIAVDGGLLQGI